jgi:hypothetical protein
MGFVPVYEFPEVSDGWKDMDLEFEDFEEVGHGFIGDEEEIVLY